MRRLYRIENADGLGPFHNGRIRDFDIEAYGNDPLTLASMSAARMPGPWAEGREFCSNLDKMRDRYRREYNTNHPPSIRFAFASRAEVYRWFLPKSRAVLKRHGYEIVAYDVPDDFCVKGDVNIGFLKVEAVKVETVKKEEMA